MSMIRRRYNLTYSTISSIVKLFEEKNWVVRKPINKRAHCFGLTKKGEEIINLSLGELYLKMKEN